VKTLALTTKMNGETTMCRNPSRSSPADTLPKQFEYDTSLMTLVENTRLRLNESHASDALPINIAHVPCTIVTYNVYCTKSFWKTSRVNENRRLVGTSPTTTATESRCSRSKFTNSFSSFSNFPNSFLSFFAN